MSLNMMELDESGDEIEFVEPEPGPSGFHAIRPSGSSIPVPASESFAVEPWFRLQAPQAQPVEPPCDQASLF